MMRATIFLAVFQCVFTGNSGAATQLTNQERAIVYVISDEATDYALEARGDVCVSFATDLPIRESKILVALRDKRLNFHSAAWCNRGPRGVEISITMPNKQTLSGTFEIVSGINDSDPIRLYGDHFATLLRSGTYVIKCNDDSDPVLEAYHLICCEKGKLKPEKAQPSN